MDACSYVAMLTGVIWNMVSLLVRSSWNKKITPATQNWFFCGRCTSHLHCFLTPAVLLRSWRSEKEKRATSSLFNFQPDASTLPTARQNNQRPKVNEFSIQTFISEIMYGRVPWKSPAYGEFLQRFTAPQALSDKDNIFREGNSK